MVDRTKTDLAGRINQYVTYRRRHQKAGASFDEALNNKAIESRAKTAKAQPVASGTGGAKKAAQRGLGGRKVRTAANAPRINSRHMKYITSAQAQRLAHYAPIIQQASQKYGVPIELICGVILQESGGKFNAVSHCGARGLMQLMPATAKRLGVANSLDPVQNIMGGTKYLRNLLDRFGGNYALALAGYNAGEGNVEKYGRKIPPFKETRAYVPSVLNYADTLWTMLRSRVGRISAARPAVVAHRTIFVKERA